MSDRLLRVHSEEEVLFWRKLTRPQEEKDDGYLGWQGKGYRWFRSPNVVCLEHYRASRNLGGPSAPSTVMSASKTVLKL